MTISFTTILENIFDFIAPFAIGGFSAMVGTTLVFPADVVKIGMQSKSEAGLKAEATTGKVVREVLNAHGIRGFYRALDPALFRQATSGSLRFGIYRMMADDIKQKNNRDLRIPEMIYLAFVSGFLGAIVGTPCEVITVRMQADAVAPPEIRRNYKHVFHGMKQIAKDEGMITLWRGSTITVGIIMALNIGLLGTYHWAKLGLKRITHSKEETQPIRMVASSIAGCVAAVIGLPFDNVKMKIQKMYRNLDGTFPYKNFSDCFRKTLKKEGVRSLWTGLPMYTATYVPYALAALVIQDYLFDKLARIQRLRNWKLQ